MKRSNYILSTLLLSLFFTSCFKDPGFPSQPQITYKSISLVKNTNSSSIFIKLNFTDGDGDLGLAAGDTLSPFDSHKVYDSLITDYLETNANFNNYFVTFLFRNADSTFRTCIDSPEICTELTARRLTQYDMRFEDLNPDRKARPISGEITREIPSAAISTLFKGRVIKLRIYIKDRALNQSNVIETDTLLIN